MPRSLHGPLIAATVLLVLGVLAVAWWVDVRAAAWVLSGGLAAAAVLRSVLPEQEALAGRGRRFDVTALVVLALAAALLSPWGLALTPG